MSLLAFADERTGDHDPGSGMPDRPKRVEVCRQALEQAGLHLEVKSPAPARTGDLQAVHDSGYLRRLETFCARGGGWIDMDTFAGPRSYDVALRAAGAVSEAVDASLAGDSPCLCLIRPPGHHATHDQAMGFCLINNVAVGAAHALGSGAKKVAILDIDVHHGNGTQEIFWTDERVLYVSIHQWPWYPWTTGDLGEVGAASGEGLNVNIPLPEGCGDAVYGHALNTIAFPVIREYGPEILIVSAGFDAHRDDHLSLQQVTAAGFGMMAAGIYRLAGEVCDGRLVLALEGGYHVDALAASVVQTARAVSGESPRKEPRKEPGKEEVAAEERLADENRAVIEKVAAFHSGRWGLGT